MKVDAVDALKRCAEALQHGNRRLADSEMRRVLDLAEEETLPATRRVIRYFAEALARRAYGLHPKYSSLLLSDWDDGVCEWQDILHAVGMTISDVIKGKPKVHVIELVKHIDIYKQWEGFFDYFDDGHDLRHLRLSFLVEENVEFLKESEEKLIRAANRYHIELKYKTIPVNSWADIDVSLLEKRDDEFVVVNCMLVFSKMLSEAVALEKVLRTVRDVIKADIMIVAEHDANHNQSDFLLRFDESLKYYSYLFHYDEVDDADLYYRYQISNIVACEGSERVERHQTWAQWKSLLIDYGFSIFTSSTEGEHIDVGAETTCEDGIVVISSITEGKPLFFISAWTTSTSPFKSSGSNEGSCFISSESDSPQNFQIFRALFSDLFPAEFPEVFDFQIRLQTSLLGSNEGHRIISSESNGLQTFQIFPEDLYLIRMASLAEISGISWNICKKYELEGFQTWANCVRSACLLDESSSPLPLKHILCIQDVCSWVSPKSKDSFKSQLEEGQGYVGQALKYNRPFYVPDISKWEKEIHPHLDDFDVQGFLLGALAINLSNAYSNCDNYVVEFLFPKYNMTLEKQKRLVHCIIDDLKDARLHFVTYDNQDSLVELSVHDPAVSNTMLVRGNPPSQSTSDFNLNGINQIVGNATDVQRATQQDTAVLDVMPTQGNLLSQSTLVVVSPGDGNVLQMPHEQLHVSATSNTTALREKKNLVALPIGDFNLNERISSSRINQTTGYHAMNKQGSHKQGTKRRRTLKSDVWDHFEKEVEDGELLAKCKYCKFQTDGSSKKGTTHLRKHFLSRHETIKSVHQSANVPSKNLETKNILKEKSVLDQDKIHMDVAKMFIKYKLPLSIIQDEVFKNPFKSLQPEFELQSENDLGLSILHVYNREKEKLLRHFDNYSCSFNFTIHLWEDDAKKIVNCCLTVQFVDDSWALKKKILSFERLKHDFDAVSLCEIFKRVLLDWNIKEKTCSLTIHNSLSNVELVHDEKIWPSGIFYLSYDKCIRDVNCMAADISLKSIYQVYEKMNHQESRGYALMNVECSNNWRNCSFILAIAAVLHPFLKLDFVTFVYKKIYGDATAKEHLDKMSKFLTDLYDKYASNCSNHTKFTTATGDTCCSSLSNADDKVLDSFIKYKASKQSRLELHWYLEKDEDSSMDIDILNWWCKNHSRFPTLGKIARDFLAIPLSTIVSSSAFAKEITKIISNNDNQEPQIINAMICCQDWLDSTKTSACDEKLMREWEARSKKYVLLWDFTHEDLELLGKWKTHKITGQRVGLVEEFRIQDTFLAPLVIPLVNAIIQVMPQVYYIGDEVVNKYFCLLEKRSKENPKMFLKHASLDSGMATMLLGGIQPILPSWINPEQQINTCKLFLPLCFSDHWALFYVDIKDQKFVWLDSRKDSEMQMPSNFQRIPEWFKGSLLPAMGLNNASDWLLFNPRDIPKQENGIDCGIFIMKYADCLTHANCIGFPFSQADMPHFRERTFLDIYNGRIHVPEEFVRS